MHVLSFIMQGSASLTPLVAYDEERGVIPRAAIFVPQERFTFGTSYSKATKVSLL